MGPAIRPFSAAIDWSGYMDAIGNYCAYLLFEARIKLEILDVSGILRIQRAGVVVDAPTSPKVARAACRHIALSTRRHTASP